MKRLTRAIIATAATASLLAGGASAASAEWQPRGAVKYHASWARIINTDNGTPSQWSTHASPSAVKDALKRADVRKVIDSREGHMKRMARKWDTPLAHERDMIVCSVAYGTWSAKGQACIEAVQVRYWNFL